MEVKTGVIQKQVFSLFLVLSLVFSSLTMTACSPKFNRSKSKSTSATSSSTSSKAASWILRLFEANSEGGSGEVSSTTSFQVSKIAVGGNVNKNQGSSASFIVKGGVVGHL